MFSHAIKLFSVSGFEIKVDPSWLLIATLITWSLAQHYFPLSLPGYSNGAYLLMGLVAMLLFFGSLLLHAVANVRASDSPTRFTPLKQVKPRIVASSVAYPGGRYKPENVYQSTSWWQAMTVHAWWNGIVESVAAILVMTRFNLTPRVL